MAVTVSWAMDRGVGALGSPDRDSQDCECSKGMSKFPFAASGAFEEEQRYKIAASWRNGEKLQTLLVRTCQSVKRLADFVAKFHARL